MAVFSFDRRIVDARRYPWGSDAFSSPWTPDLITTALWLDAADSSTITLDDSINVEQWDDKSGNGYDAAATGSARPLLTASGLSFNGSGQSMLGSGQLFQQYQDGYGLFQVSSFETTSSRFTFMYGSDAQRRCGIQHFAGDTLFHANTGTNIEQRYLKPHDEAYMMRSAIYNGQGIGNTERLKCYENAHLHTTGSYVNSIPSDLGSTMPDQYLLCRRDSASDTTKSIYSELVVLDYTPDEETREKIEGYLAHKWGLTANLPSDHPYKAFAPRA